MYGPLFSVGCAEMQVCKVCAIIPAFMFSTSVTSSEPSSLILFHSSQCENRASTPMGPSHLPPARGSPGRVPSLFGVSDRHLQISPNVLSPVLSYT